MPTPFEASAIGTLYIVATPIGNLEDITLRALRVLKEADLIAAEDTRHTRKLLTHFGIGTPLISYHAHNQATRGPELIRRLQNGQNVALVSDAGTPGFSDPGADLVARAWDAGVKVEAVPGPAAGVAALSLSGFKGDVTLCGFSAPGGGPRLKMFQGLASEPRVIILYESPRRLARTLEEIAGDHAGPPGPGGAGAHQEVRGNLAGAGGGDGRPPAGGRTSRGNAPWCCLPPATEAAAAGAADLEGLLLDRGPGKRLQGRRLADQVAAGPQAAPAPGLPGLPGPEGPGPAGREARPAGGRFAFPPYVETRQKEPAGFSLAPAQVENRCHRLCFAQDDKGTIRRGFDLEFFAATSQTRFHDTMATDDKKISTMEKELWVENRLGLHARPAAKIATVAQQFEADITLEKDGLVVNARDLLDVLALDCPQGTRLVLRARGPQAREAAAP